MGLFDFKKPKWRHKDPAVRRAAVGTIDPGETELLAALGRDDPDREVRQTAISRLTDLAALDRLAQTADPEDLPLLVARRDFLLFRHTVACQEPDGWRDTLERITSPELLAELAVNASLPDARLAAVRRIDDQLLLAEIVRGNCGKKPALAALEKIADAAILADLSGSAASKTARRLAADRVAEIERLRNPAAEQEQIARQLHALGIEAAQLQASLHIDAASLRMAAIREEWQRLDPSFAHPDANTFQQSCAEFAARYQETMARRKMGEEKAAQFDLFQARLDEICGIIERLSCNTAPNAETLKEKAVADWDAAVSTQAMGFLPSPALTKRFAAACRAFDANREKINREQERVGAIERKCAEVRALIAAHELKKAAVRLAEAEKRLAPLRFSFFSKSGIERLVADAAAELKRTEANIRQQNLSRRREICAALAELAQAEKPGYIEKQLHALRQDWQRQAQLDDAEGRALEQRFQDITATLAEKLKTLEHEQDWQLWANLTLKQQLTDRVVALAEEENLETVLAMIKQAQAEWKTIGPVPQQESQKLWQEFHSACNRNFERALPFLDELKTKKAAALDRRRAISAQAAALADSNDWQQTTLAIKAMQEEWKTLPHGPRKEERELYQQFRAACDRFFARRQEHYQSQDEQRRQNLAAKERLCEEAEQLAAAPELDHAARFKRLQAEWKKTGPAPQNKENDAWQRFRTACDCYFNWLTEEQEKNLQQQEALCAEAEKLAAEATTEGTRKETAARLTALQQQWKETGPAPPDRSEAVWQRFRAACDHFFAERHREYEQEEQQRLANQVCKEEILARAEELAGGSTGKETAAQLQQLQKEWFDIGPVPRTISKELNERFKSLCDAFFEDRRQYFSTLKTEQLENQKKKESLCLRLENLLGLSSEPATGERGKALSLAEELKQAMENNFMLAGRRREKKDISAEVRRIEQEWQKIGPVPPKQIRPLTARYRRALDAFYASQRPPGK